mmetsp:Transcript_27732/g.60151  ORF Transcript_27732/g.60151 Transcript_27732/m.60151 type:complete len:171 (+) Transcript_27732:551-1063(+)
MPSSRRPTLKWNWTPTFGVSLFAPWVPLSHPVHASHDDQPPSLCIHTSVGHWISSTLLPTGQATDAANAIASAVEGLHQSTLEQEEMLPGERLETATLSLLSAVKAVPISARARIVESAAPVARFGEDRYARHWALETLRRTETVQGLNAAMDAALTTRWCPFTAITSPF